MCSSRLLRRLPAGLALLALSSLIATAPTFAAFHTFRINEVYSSPDGTIQFVEMREATGSNFEYFWAGQALTSTQGATTRTFTFPSNLASTQTANRSVLIATPGFAALAGVTPDFVVPAPFLFPGGGTLNYAGADSVTYPALPGDGVSSLDRNGTSGPNTPTNFAGQTGTLAPPAPPSPPPPVAAASIPALGPTALALVVAIVAGFGGLFVRRR